MVPVFIGKEGFLTLFQDDNRRSLASERHFVVKWGSRFLRGVAAEVQAQLQLEWRGCGGVGGRSLRAIVVCPALPKKISKPVDCSVQELGACSLSTDLAQKRVEAPGLVIRQVTGPPP